MDGPAPSQGTAAAKIAENQFTCLSLCGVGDDHNVHDRSIDMGGAPALERVTTAVEDESGKRRSAPGEPIHSTFGRRFYCFEGKPKNGP